MGTGLLLLLGTACTAWFAFELARMGAAAARGQRPQAWDARSGRPLVMRRDRRNRGRRSSDRRPGAEPAADASEATFSFWESGLSA